MSIRQDSIRIGRDQDLFEERLKNSNTMDEIEALKKIFGRFLLQEQTQ